jgi:hypothetical protein
MLIRNKYLPVGNFPLAAGETYFPAGFELYLNRNKPFPMSNNF